MSLSLVFSPSGRGGSIDDIVGPMPFIAQQSMLDEANAPGLRNYWRTPLVDPLPDEAIDVVVERCQDLRSPYPDCA